MGKYFGTDGFRGEANITLTADHAFRIGRYIGYLFSKEHPCRVVIGKDTRRSSYMFEYALVAGLTASGAEAYLLHVTTTPSVAYVVRADGFDCGIMISASHNPYYDNGIKLISASGEKMGEEITDEIEAYLDGNRPEPPLAQKENIGATYDYSAGRNRYIGYLISLATRSFKKLSIGLDCANGSAWMIARQVFEALGATVHAIGIEPNGLNINRGVGSTHIEHLSAYVRECRADIGFAFDGDADRCIAVDENGNTVNGDHILYILARAMAKRGMLTNNTVVTTVMSNLGLYRALDEAGIAYVQTTVGDRYIYENMRATGNALGGEQSGHIIVGKYATTGDGILTAILLMDAVLSGKQPLSRLSAPVKMLPQLTVNLTVTDKDAVMADPAVRQALAELEAQLVGRGRILLRRSGTEPLIRIMVEAEEDAECRRIAESLAEVIRERGH